MSNKLGNYRVPIETHIVALGVAVILVFASLYVPVTVNSKEDLKEVQLGLPLHFVVQDQSHYDPPFPYQMRFYSIWENATKVYFTNLLLSVLIVFIVIDGGLIILWRLLKGKSTGT